MGIVIKTGNNSGQYLNILCDTGGGKELGNGGEKKFMKYFEGVSSTYTIPPHLLYVIYHLRSHQ